MHMRYELDLQAAHTQLAAVTLIVEDPGETLRLAMPAWTPGSYKLRDFARHVQDFQAEDDRGRALAPRKLDKQTWELCSGGAPRVQVRYRVWCDELTVRTSHLDSGHALVNGAAMFLYVVGAKERPARLRVRTPQGWRVFTGLPADGDEGWRAADYDTLIDHPIEAGPHEALEFVAAGRPHRLVFCGAGNHDPADLAAATARIVEANAAIFGGLPYQDYTFITHLTPEGGGGLEHVNSSCLQFKGHVFHRRKERERFLSLVAHEHFHVWNVKRIRPHCLGPFDYSREVHTPMLWVCEGWTAYYDEYQLLRAGIVGARRYLSLVARRVQSLLETPGRRRMSIAAASFHAWTKLYQPSANNVNSTVSYYEKGQLVALLLDLEIRRRSAGRRSLDDVLRALWGRWRRDGRGYEDGDIRQLAQEVAGADLQAFFDDYVEGTREPDFDAALRPFGLALADRPEDNRGDLRGERPRAWAGVVLRDAGPAAVVVRVLEGSPAWEAGVNAGDELLALDGQRVQHDSWKERLFDHAPGERVRLALFRRDRLLEVELALLRSPHGKLRIEALPEAQVDHASRDLFRGWLGSEWTVAPARSTGEGGGGQIGHGGVADE